MCASISRPQRAVPPSLTPGHAAALPSKHVVVVLPEPVFGPCATELGSIDSAHVAPDLGKGDDEAVS